MYVDEFDPKALALNEVSGRLFGNTLLTEEEIVRAAAPYERPSGIYFLVIGSEVIYVGQSRNIMSRMSDHYPSFKFSRFAFLPVPERHLNVVESLYIHLLRPRGNAIEQTPQGAVVAAPFTFEKLLDLAPEAQENRFRKEASA